MNTFRLGGITAVFFVFIPSLHAVQPWDSPFQADTRAIIEASSREVAPEHPEIIVLLEDRRYLVHGDGRIDFTIRKVYRIEQQDAVEDWSSVEQSFQPWYQRKPELKARVIAKSGEVRWLDATTIADSPARQLDASIFSDERVLRAPLPGVAPGSIIEWEIVVRDKAPLLDAGVAQRVTIGDNLPTERFHLLIEAEEGVNLRTESQLIPLSALRRTAVGKGTRVECELGPIAAKKDFEWNLPFDVAPSPYIAFSTGKSWQAVAARYAEIVEQRIQNSDLGALIEGIHSQDKAIEIASALTARLHKNVRYTGVEFGEAAIVPTPPSETVKRGYGDCKDKAILLVAMLRAAGLRADIALLNSGFGLDVDANLPGLGGFDHAIVYVASNPPLWIDATASDTRVGFLPAADAGRLALIANRATQAVLKTPDADASHNWERQKIEVRMSEFGPGIFQDAVEVSGGGFEPTARAAYGNDQEKSKETLENWAKRSFAAKSLGKYEVMRRDDMTGPFRMIAEVLGARSSNTGANDASVILMPGMVLQGLPYPLVGALETDAKDAKPRQHDFVLPDPYHLEVQYLIIPPALFKVGNLPASAEVRLGPATFSKHFESNPDGSVQAIYRFDSGKRTITAAEFAEFRARLKESGPLAAELISFVPETAEAMALGQTSKAISLLREQVSRAPKDAPLHVRLSSVLLGAGLGDAALREAKTAVDLDPASAESWNNLAWTYQHDSFGRLRNGDWNFAEAEKALRKSMELDPDDELPALNLAILLEHSAQGWRYGSGSRLKETIVLYRGLTKKPQHQLTIDQNLAVALLRDGQFGAAKDVLSKLSGDGPTMLLNAIAAIEESPARSIIKTQAAYPDVHQRGMYLGITSLTLTQLRRYDAAAVLMNAAARALNDQSLQTRAELLGKLKRWPDAILAEDDPRSLVQRLLVELFRGTLTPEGMKAVASKRFEGGITAEKVTALQAEVDKARDSLASLSVEGIEQEGILDFILSLVELEKHGDDQHGYLVKAMTPGKASPFFLYVVREEDKYRLLGGPPSGLDGVGGLVLDLLDKGDVKGAQWWLDRATKDAEARSDGTGRPSVTGLWSGVREETRGPSAIRVAAAALIGGSTGSATALATLEEARVKAPTALEKSQVDKAICETLEAGSKWNDLEIAARRLEASKLFSEEGFRYFIKAATNARKWKDLEDGALARLRLNPTNLTAMRATILSKWKQGDLSGAMQWVTKMSKSELAGADEQIYAAWFAMGQDKADQDALATLRKAKERAGSDKRYSYTLAMMEAVLGMADDAQADLGRAVNGQYGSSVPAVAWAVHGKICQQWGFTDCSTSSLEKAREQVGKGHPDESDEWLRVVIEK